jgi:hypothetical protein
MVRQQLHTLQAGRPPQQLGEARERPPARLLTPGISGMRPMKRTSARFQPRQNLEDR